MDLIEPSAVPDDKGEKIPRVEIAKEWFPRPHDLSVITLTEYQPDPNI